MARIQSGQGRPPSGAAALEASSGRAASKARQMMTAAGSSKLAGSLSAGASQVAQNRPLHGASPRYVVSATSCQSVPSGGRGCLYLLLARYCCKVCAGDVQIGAPCSHSMAAVQGSVAIARQARGERKNETSELSRRPSRGGAQMSPSQGGEIL